MLAPQTVFACQIVISTTDSLKRKASKYVLATFKETEANQMSYRGGKIKSHIHIFPPYKTHEASVVIWHSSTQSVTQCDCFAQSEHINAMVTNGLSLFLGYCHFCVNFNEF